MKTFLLLLSLYGLAVYSPSGHGQENSNPLAGSGPAKTVISVALRTKGNANTMVIGATLQAVAYATYSDGSVGTLPDAQGNHITAWNTTNHSVAKISTLGHVTAFGAGRINLQGAMGSLVASPWRVTVNRPVPPTISCSASPSTVTVGASAMMTATASSPDGSALVYSWATSAGSISGSGKSVTLNTTGSSAGVATVSCTVTDNQALTATATTSVEVVAPSLKPALCAVPTIATPAPIAVVPVTPVLPQGTINVLLQGVTGDGATNDSPAIQSLIDNYPNGVMFFPLASYRLDNPSPYQAGLLLSGFHGTVILANGARFLCDNATTSAGQCLSIQNSSGVSFDNLRVGYLDESRLPLSRNEATNNAILVENSTNVSFSNTTVEASTGSGIWVTNSTGISFLGGTSVSNTTADGLHFENAGNGTVTGYTSHNTGDDALSATNIAPSNPNCGLAASNLQIFDSKARGIAVAGACGSAFSNFFIDTTAAPGLGVGQDQTIDSRVPVNSTFSNGTVVNAGRYPSAPAGTQDCIDVAESSATTITNIECYHPMVDGLFVFGGADEVHVSGLSVDAAANVGLQVVDSQNFSLANTVSRNAAKEGYAIQQATNGNISSALVCSSGTYGFYHSGTTDLVETQLTAYDAAVSNSLHRIWWAENDSYQVSVNGLAVLDDQQHTAPDVIGGYDDPAGGITIDGITQDLLGSTLTVNLP